MNIDEKMWSAAFNNFEIEPVGGYIDLNLSSVDAGGFPVSWYVEGEYESPYWGHTFLWWLELPRGLFYYNMSFSASLSIDNPDDHLTAGGARFTPALLEITEEINDGNGDYDLWQVYGALPTPGERLYQDTFTTTSFVAGGTHQGMFPVKHSGDKFSLVAPEPFGTDLDGDLTSYSVAAHLALFRIQGLS